MRKYETAVIFDLDWEDEERNAFVERLENIISGFSGEVFDREDWGVRKLAYRILKRNSGHYLFLRYAGERGVVEELERVMGLNEKVLRYLTTRFEKDIKGKYPTPPPIDEFLDRDITELQTLKAQWRRGTATQPAAEGERQVRDTREKSEKAEDEKSPEVTTETMAEEAPEVPAEGTTEAPAEGTTEAPAEGTTEAPAEGTTEAPAEGMTEAPAEGTTEAPAEGTTEAPAEGTTEAPAEEKAEAQSEKEDDKGK